MKILRIIGGFFAKIGRWIANTAWIQPLLIVGGIFAIIFSIPYIKKAFEKDPDTTDYNYVYYQNHSIGLDKDGDADKLLGWLADGNGLEGKQGSIDKIKEKFGEKFFLSFVEADSECGAAVSGYEALENKWGDSNFWGESFDNHGQFKLITILMDVKDDEGVKKGKKLANEHKSFFEALEEGFHDNDSYALYTNLNKNGDSSKVTTLKSGIDEVDKDGTDLTKDTFKTPFTLMFDYSKTITNGFFNVRGITAFFFNMNDVMNYDTKNSTTKAQFLRDCWTYTNLFEPENL